MRKVFEQIIINDEGEQLSRVSEYVSKNTETFFMGRTTEGIEWLLEFSNLTEIQLLILMLELENPKNNGVITFTSLQVRESASILKVSEISIRKAITGLVLKKFLKRVARANYIANPKTFFKGGTQALKDKWAVWEKY